MRLWRDWGGLRAKKSYKDASCLKTSFLPSAGQTQLPSVGRWITPRHSKQPTLRCSAVVLSPSPRPARGEAALLSQNTGAGMKGCDLSALFFKIFLHSLPLCFSLACSVLLSSLFLSVSLGQKRGGNNKQPEEIFPVGLHTLQCTGIGKWSLGAKTGEKYEKHQ